VYSTANAMRAAKFTIILKSVSQLLGLLTTFLLVKLLTEESYGAYNSLLSALTVMGGIFSLGIGNTLARYVPQYFKDKNINLVIKLCRYAFVLRFISLLIILFVGFQFKEELARTFNLTPYLASLLPFALVILLHFQSRLLSIVLSSCLLQGINQTAQILLVSVKTVVYVYFLVSSTVPSVYEILIVDVAAYLIMLITLMLGYYLYIGKNTVEGRSKFTAEEKKKIIKYGAFNNLNDVGLVSLGRDIDVLFIASIIK